MSISVHTNAQAIAERFLARSKQVRFATSVALTRTAKHAQQAVVEEISRAFDKPTSYTRRSIKFKAATKRDLTATVFVNGANIGGKTHWSPADLLGHQFAGGVRQRKRIEQWLQSAGMISAGEYVAPGAGARLDQYGNMSRGQVQQIMSQLRLGLDPYSWTSMSPRSQRSVQRAGRMFWSRGGHLPRGVWVDQGGQMGVRPLLIVVSTPRYRQRLDMRAVVRRVTNDRFPGEMRTALKQAMDTAR